MWFCNFSWVFFLCCGVVMGDTGGYWGRTFGAYWGLLGITGEKKEHPR